VRCRLEQQKTANGRAIAAIVAVFAVGILAIPAWWFLRSQEGGSGTVIAPESTSGVSGTAAAEPEEEEPEDEAEEEPGAALPGARGADPWAALEEADAGRGAPAVAASTDAGETDDASSPERDQAIEREMKSVRVTIYTAPWCSACKNATSWMRANGVYFVEHDIESDSYASEKRKRLTPSKGLPTIDVEGKVMTGFSSRGLMSAIRDAATKRVDRRR
jgi:glutaredoxin